MSADEDIANEVAKGCLIILGIVALVIVAGIYAWHHFRFAP